jgi:O-acetyl-ADP-ribose deacetylase (regulator of RNase III)
MPPRTRKRLFYITHIENIPSILAHGVLSHAERDRQRIDHTTVYDSEIVASRGTRPTPDGRSLWEFANLYLQPRNAMLYRVLFFDRSPGEVAVLSLKPNLLNRKDIYITTGNAASSLSDILPADEGKRRLRQILKRTEKDYWNEEDGSKREMMAECLVPGFVSPSHIDAVYVDSEDAQFKVQAMVRGVLPVIVEPMLFFRSRPRALTVLLHLAQGDLFFSRMQTLTVSVNTVGVMGKGLASRAKYQFPDVYVVYQDACRKGWLGMGKPYLYQRERAYERELADDPESLPDDNGDGGTWFLLFATKRHWREDADLAGIEQGLMWLAGNYKDLGIKSLAMPALGCGLGNLPWEKVGPLMCGILQEFDIPVRIYLPAEHSLKPETLTSEFLIGR